MNAKAIVVLDPSGKPLANAIGIMNGFYSPLTNADAGYALFTELFAAGPTFLIIVANGYKSYVQPVNLSDSNQRLIVGGNSTDPMNLNLPSLSFSKPSFDVIRQVKGNFGGIVVPELQFGFLNKVLFTPGYVVENQNVRQIIRSRYKDAGFKHFPISTYNDNGVYHDYYPPWDDSLINQYLEELLSDDLIPLCSLFADNSKTLKKNASPDLVLSGFVGWENPTPILRPALDNDNLFWVAKQFYPEALIYWHNPAGQGAPYVNPIDWGKQPGDEVNGIVWNYMVSQSGCQGLLCQNVGWLNSGNDSVNRLNDFVVRLINGGDYWPKADLIDFEEVVYFNTTMQGNPILTGEPIRSRVPQLTGYCNG